MSDDQQRILGTNNQTQQNLAALGRDQSARLNSLLSQPFSLKGLPSGGSAGSIRLPTYQSFSGGPSLKTSFNAGGPIQTQLGDAGEITRTYGTDFSQDRQRVEDALMARMQPQIDKDREALETQLANRGIRMDSRAYGAAQDNFGRGVNDARMGAILNAGQEQSRLVGMEADRAGFENMAQNQAFGQNLAAGQFNNAAVGQQFGQNAALATFGNTAKQQMFDNKTNVTSLNNAIQQQRFGDQSSMFNMRNIERNQALQEALMKRQQPLNEIISLIGGTQLQNPSFANTPQASVAGTDIAGITQNGYANQVGAYNQQMANQNQMLGGLFSAGANLLPFMMSDRRTKTDIEKRGETADGQNVYDFRYKGEPKGAKHTGLMAQEVERRDPGAVVTLPNGLKMVNYSRALGGVFGKAA